MTVITSKFQSHNLARFALTGIFSVAFAVGCGRAANKEADTEEPALEGSINSDLLFTDESSSETVTAEVLDEVGSAAEQAAGDAQLDSNSQSSTALNLAAAAGSKYGDFTRSCVNLEEQKAAQVTIERSVSKGRLGIGAYRAAANKVGAEEKIVRTWSKADGEVKCLESEKSANIDLKNMDGLKLDITFTSSVQKALRAKKMKNKNVASSANVTSSGTRSIVFTQAALAEGAVSIERQSSISLKSKRNIEHAKANGEVIAFEANMETLEGAPLEVNMVRNAATLELQERTIESGTVVSTGKKGGKISTSYAAVKYVRSNGCLMPISGTISGTIEAPDQAVKSFSIEFVGEGKALYKVEGKEDKEVPSACAAN